MDPEGLERACRQLRRGRVVACPTEAVWGLSCDPHSRAAVRRLLELKGRDPDKGLIVVAAGEAQLGPLLEPLDAGRRARLRAAWPGPVTWLVPDPRGLYPAWVRGRHNAVAVRVSAHPAVRALCEAFGGPLVSTSANRAGEEAVRSRAALEELFGGRLGAVVDGEPGGAARPSAIRDLLTGRSLRA